MYGGSGNYNSESFERSHCTTLKKWHQKLSFKGVNAQKKVMRGAELYDAHAIEGPIEGDTETQVQESTIHDASASVNAMQSRWGRGGFRGKVDLTVYQKLK